MKCSICGTKMNQIHSGPVLSSSAIRTIPTGGTVPTNSAGGSQSRSTIIEWKCPNCGHYEQENVG
jgi:DNA-directed RNA polymerase subunit RPC12/RpoP